MTEITEVQKPKIPLKRKLAFASADIFGGGGFNVINFLFVPFLTLVVGIPMVWVSPILLFSKFWDGLIDPFIGEITDAKKDNKFGKRRFFMLIFAPIMAVCLVLLFFPWNMLTSSLALKIVFVFIMYMLYATAQSFILIPYYSLASEITDDYTERNKANAMRIAFSVLASIACVVLPDTIVKMVPDANNQGLGYIVMAAVFGVLFALAVLVTALFAKEEVHTPPIHNKVSLKQFFRPLKMKTYRQYVGMQICSGMGMAIMSSFFFIYCDFYLRQHTYRGITEFLAASDVAQASRFPIATIAAAAMFIAQIFALPMYVKIIKLKNKRFAYVMGAIIWCALAVVLLILPAEAGTKAIVNDNNITQFVSQGGTPDWLIIGLAFIMGFGIGGCVYVPHSSLGDVCNVGELYFGERTEGGFSGLTNFLNTTAQAIGLAIPPFIMGLFKNGYVETQYIERGVYDAIKAGSLSAEQELGMALDSFKVTIGGSNVQLVPLAQSETAQWLIRITMSILPILILALAISFALRYKLTRKTQERVINALKMDRESDEFKQEREDILNSL